MAEVRASSVKSQALKRLADIIRMAEKRGEMEFLPFNPMSLFPVSSTTLENLAYGNLPMAIPSQSNIPITKTGRKQEVAELAGLGMMVPVAGRGVVLGDVLTQAVTRNPQATPMRALEEIARMSPVPQIAPKGIKRSEIQAEAKSLGLPSSGKTKEIQELINIVKSDPRTWTQEQYTLIRPHLAIHQDFRPGSAERSESIMREGLRSGMVDYLEPMEKGQYSFAKGLVGSDAYLFPTRGLKFKSASDPHLAPGNIPLFRIKPKKGQNIYEAIVSTAERRQADDAMEQFLQGQTAYRGSHAAPNAKRYGATLDSLEGIMPSDVYSSRGKGLYGLGNPQVDAEWFSAAFRAKGKPDAEVTIYRAVPKGVKDINSGDWVTTSKTYADMHGENTVGEGYEIVSKKVKAKTLSSEGYPYEFGYNE